MPDDERKYIWRCARCSNHFVTIARTEGVIKQEKKCPKCKSLNFLTLIEKEIFIECRGFDPKTDNFISEHKVPA